MPTSSSQPRKSWLARLFGDERAPDEGTPGHGAPMLAQWLPYRSFDPKTEVFYQTDSIAFALEVAPLIGADERTGEILAQFLSEALPPCSRLQILSFQSPRVGQTIARYALPRYAASGVHKKIAEHRSRMLRHGAWNSLAQDGPFHVRQHRCVLSVSFKLGKGSVEELITVRDSITSLLQSINVDVSRYSPVDLIALIDDLTAPAFDVSDHVEEYCELDPIADQCVRRDVQTVVQADRILVSCEPLRAVTTLGGDTEFEEIRPDTFDYRFFSVRNLPTRWAPWDCQKVIGDMFADKLRPGCPTMTSLCIVYQDEEAASSKAGYKFMRTSSLADTPSARLLPQLKDQSREWEHVQQELRVGRKLVQVYYTVGIMSPKGKGDANERTIKSIYKAAGWDLLDERFLQIMAFMSCLPMTLGNGLDVDLKRMKRLRTMLTTTAANLAPLQGEFLGGAKAFVTGSRSANRQIATSTNLTGTIPGYTGQRLPEEALADDPDRLTSQGAAGALGNDPWRVVTNPDRTVVTLDRDGLLRARAVEENPDAYLAGSSLGAANAQCQPLPPSGGGTEFYEATCEQGAQPIDEARTCRVPLVIQADGSQYWEYSCYSDEPQPGHAGVCWNIESALQGGGCTLIDRERIGFSCLQWVYPERGGRPWCAEPGGPNFREVWSCPVQIPGVRGGLLRNTTRIVSESRDEAMCQAATDGLTCTQAGEVCTGQPETRTINGLAVTRPCWEWERTYQCSSTTQATDCGEIEDNTRCTFLREECLDDPQVGACQVATRVYRCPIPGGGTTDPSQYICGDDVYCIDGECEPIEREASTEFKDALVGLHTLGQANAEFDEADFTLFSGTRETCTKKVFGISNCCSGKGVPLLTPFLCPAAERELDKKDDKGLCHRVGSYCSDRVLGVCVTRKDAYCCFESKLSRILQQQGRQQINKRWDEPKRETCKGFTLEEFSRLDLSVMDFTEVYADFLDAAKVPDELDTSRQIQQRIEDYLQQNGRP